MDIFHTINAHFMGRDGRGKESVFSLFREFESSLVWEFELFREFGLFREFCEVCKIGKFGVLRSLLRDCLRIGMGW